MLTFCYEIAKIEAVELSKIAKNKKELLYN